MTYFKIDIPKLNESVSRYQEIKKECLDDINLVYRGLGYTESAWNDLNAYSFIEKVKKDQCKLNEYFNCLDALYEEIQQFKTNIDSICSKHDYKKNSIILKFDDNDIELVKKYLDNALILLNDSLNKINVVTLDLRYIGLLYNLRIEIKLIKESIIKLKEEISEFVNSVNNEIYDSKFRLKRKGDFDFDLKPTNYTWKIVNLGSNNN